MGGSLSTNTPSESKSCGRHSDIGIRKTGVTGGGGLMSALSTAMSGGRGYGWEKGNSQALTALFMGKRIQCYFSLGLGKWQATNLIIHAWVEDVLHCRHNTVGDSPLGCVAITPQTCRTGFSTGL